jgi:hypothetical protein
MRKAKSMANRMRLSVLAVVLAVVGHPAGARACSACYGDPDSPTSHGLTLAILALATVVMAVLGGVATFFVQASRKAELLEATAAARALIEKS